MTIILGTSCKNLGIVGPYLHQLCSFYLSIQNQPRKLVPLSLTRLSIWADRGLGDGGRIGSHALPVPTLGGTSPSIVGDAQRLRLPVPTTL